MRRVLIPSLLAHHSDLLPQVLRRYNHNRIQRQETNNDYEKDKSSSFYESHFREGDVKSASTGFVLWMLVILLMCSSQKRREVRKHGF